MAGNSKYKTVLSIPTGKNGLNKNVISIVAFLNGPESFQEFFKPTSNNDLVVRKTSSNENLQVKKSIHVCTFCHLFSPSKSEIVAHITAVHEPSLPPDKSAEDFVSQLQALPNENKKKIKNKGGRPRKKEGLSVVKEKTVVPEPVLGPDGLYWCQKCHRHFKKPRQLTRHVCLEITAENGTSCESAADSDSTSDFQTYMDIEPTPWLRRPKHSVKSNRDDSKAFLHSPSDETLRESDVPRPENRPDTMKTFWRDDPNYVHLFEKDTDRFAFEEHLKSIDYSCVDSLFVKSENKSKNHKKRKRSSNITLYFCTICQKKFHSLFHIRMHCLTHTDVKPFTCPKCPYRSNTKGSLYTHMRNHTGKLFHCSKCAFKTIKRSHLLEHEQTHSTVMQLCKLCKNTYKTVKSLIAHVHRYHNNPEGKRYAKFLSGRSSKDLFIKCNICQKKFKTQTSFSTHTHNAVSNPAIKLSSPEKIQKHPSTAVSTHAIAECSPENIENTPSTAVSTHARAECSSENIENSPSTAVSNNAIAECSPENIQNAPSTEVSVAITECLHENIQKASSSEVNKEQLPPILDNNIEYTNEMQMLKDPLGEIVLNDLLQQKDPEIYHNVFQQCSNSHIQTESESLSNSFTVESSSRELTQLEVDNQFHTSNTVLEECEKRFGIDLLNECLRDSSFANQVMVETCGQSSKLASDSKSFGLHEIQMAYPGQSIISTNITENSNISKNLSHLDSELHDKSDSTDFISAEPKSAETKLFEKCRQTPAYVCCVCSAIYICTATLKIHLKEHINTQYSLIEQENEDLEMSDADATIDSVCEMLEDSDNERELEKLYMSSLDLMYYLPEVSVLLENDSKFTDSVLDDISSFPMSDKYDESEFTSKM